MPQAGQARGPACAKRRAGQVRINKGPSGQQIRVYYPLLKTNFETLDNQSEKGGGMLGEQIGEFRGKRTGRKVLSVDGGFKVEVAFEDRGKLLGTDVNQIVTYWSAGRPDGSLYGEGQGLAITNDGEAVTWKGQGVGKFTGGGAVSYRGAVYYSTASPKLTRLNTVAAVFEFEVDAEGNTHSKLWEWK